MFLQFYIFFILHLLYFLFQLNAKISTPTLSKTAGRSSIETISQWWLMLGHSFNQMSRFWHVPMKKSVVLLFRFFRSIFMYHQGVLVLENVCFLSQHCYNNFYTHFIFAICKMIWKMFLYKYTLMHATSNHEVCCKFQTSILSPKIFKILKWHVL